VGRPQAAFEVAEYAWHLSGKRDWKRADEAAQYSALVELLDCHGVPWKEI
jgi:hypothetical protein